MTKSQSTKSSTKTQPGYYCNTCRDGVCYSRGETHRLSRGLRVGPLARWVGPMPLDNSAHADWHRDELGHDVVYLDAAPPTIWVVTKPTDESTVADICFEANIARALTLGAGGLVASEIDSEHATRDTAERRARTLIENRLMRRLITAFPFVAAWHSMTGSEDFYTLDTLLKAEHDGASHRSIYRDHSTRGWVTLDEVENAQTRTEVEQRAAQLLAKF